MDISILIATYNRSGLLKTTLESFLSLDVSGIDWEILIADNANDSETSKIINSFKSKLPIISIVETKRGKNNALNSLLPIAKGELFVFTDDDIIADKKWLKEIRAGSTRWPDADIFGGKILPKWPNGKLPTVDLQNRFFLAAFGLTIFDTDIEKPWKAEDIYGPNLTIRKKVFNDGWRYNPDIGPCGSNYIMGSETELLRRLEKSGYKTIYLPKVITYHQIREEQLTEKWLFGRAFRTGRTLIHYDSYPKVAIIFSYPRCFLKEISIILFRILFTYLNFNVAKRLLLKIRYWRIRGMIFQYRLHYLDKKG